MTAARLLAAVLLLLSACSSGARPQGDASPAGLEIPSSPYSPFPYVSPVQRATFAAFLECAHVRGVEFDGPYADSSGQGAVLRVAPGAHVSGARRKRVARACPQGTVAFAVTPDPSLSQAGFERVLTRFARCVRAHGVPKAPDPVFGSPDPYDGLRWPLNWNDPRVVEAVRRCAGPLRDFVFGV